jgi:DNA polymerase-3 subunit chi
VTRVGFYVVQQPGQDERLRVAARLTDKALRRGHRIFINAASEQQAAHLDDLLWSFRPASFLPHALYSAQATEPVLIGWGQDPGEHDDLLVNLDLDVPRFFSRFHRVAEVVTQDEDSLAALRRSWRFYKDRGYALEKHDL